MPGSPTPGQAWGRFPQTLEQRLAAMEARITLLEASGELYFGIGDPNGVVTASVPALYYDLTITSDPIQWIKTSGTDTNTGWV
jgi:hypothetical protein